MPVDAAIVLAPRFTTLVGSKGFTTPPLDVSGFTARSSRSGGVRSG
jgi:hypothetical protein